MILSPECFMRFRFLVLKAYWKLIVMDLFLGLRKFNALLERVRRYPIGKVAPAPDALERICAALDLACIWYRKEVLCLQRSAATACLLKDYGVPAEMIIGVQQLPFKAHAWVEVMGKIVSDKPYMHEMYAEVDRC
jgi:hypothetical protein